MFMLVTFHAIANYFGLAVHARVSLFSVTSDISVLNQPKCIFVLPSYLYSFCHSNNLTMGCHMIHGSQ